LSKEIVPLKFSLNNTEGMTFSSVTYSNNGASKLGLFAKSPTMGLKISAIDFSLSLYAFIALLNVDVIFTGSTTGTTEFPSNRLSLILLMQVVRIAYL